MKALHYIALVLVIIGAVNWGLVGLFQFDLVATLFGGESEPLSRIVYSLVGLSGLIVAGTSLALQNGGRVTDHAGTRTAVPSR